MNIVFRVDSSTQIGSGHLMRCLTLAARLQKEHEGAEIFFVARELDDNINYLVEKRGFKWLKLPKMESVENLAGYEKWLTVKAEVDAEQTVDLLRQIGQVDMLVVDSYAIDEAWEKIARSYTKKIMVIDDLANRRHDCDILLDQNYYKNLHGRYMGLVPKDCEMLLGPKHALLRGEFYETKQHLKQRDGNIKNIFVFFGGSDLTNETIKALKAIDLLAMPVEVDVVVGGSNAHRDEVERFCASRKNMHYYCQIDNTAELMNKADLAIGAGGSATWERCFLELPTLVIAIAENQVKIAEDCAETGAISYLGEFAVVSVEGVCEAIKGWTREKMIVCQEACRRMLG